MPAPSKVFVASLLASTASHTVASARMVTPGSLCPLFIASIRLYGQRHVAHSTMARAKPAAPQWSIPIVAGSAGGGVILINRLVSSFGPIADTQGRADLIAVLALGALLLGGLSVTEVATREATSVRLTGSRGRAVSRALAHHPQAAAAVEWVASSAIEATPAVTALVWWADGGLGTTLLRLGILALASAPPIDGGSPLLRTARSNTPVTLPDLQALPARVELRAFPANTQSVVLQPFCQGRGVLLLGADRKRAFRPGDLLWVASTAAMLDDVLPAALDGSE